MAICLERKSTFQNYDSLNPNTAERKLWESLKRAFDDEPCVAYFRYPIFTSTGNLRKEPDVLFVHRELGLWILECKGCHIDNIQAIQGHSWEMNDWYREEESPALQAEDAMFAINSKLDQRRETRRLLSCHYRVALPFVSAQEWKDRGFSDLPCTQGVVLLEDDLKPSVLREKFRLGSWEKPQTPLSDEQWQNIIAFLGGSLPKQDPRGIPSGTPYNSPVRVIGYIESQFRFLDEEQQKVAFEIPDGPQRIRGLAGTGKTVLLAKRAAKMLSAHPDWRIAFVFFTRSLYEQIRNLIRTFYLDMNGGNISKEELERINKIVMHAWGGHTQRGFYSKLALRMGERPLIVDDLKEIFKHAVSPEKGFRYVCETLEKSGKEVPEIFDAILIDEGQDLPPSFYRLAYKSLSDPKRLYWAYDEAQGIGSLIVPRPLEIFGLNPDGTPVVDLGGNKLPDGTTTSPVYAGGLRKAHNLSKCYRTPRMILMAAHAINMGFLRPEGCLQGVSNKADWEALGYTIVDGDFSDASVKAGKTVTVTREIEYSPHPIDQDNFPHKDALGSPLRIVTFTNAWQEQEWIAEQIQEDLKLGFQPWDLMITCPTGNNEKEYFQQLKKQLLKRGIKSIIAGVDTDPNTFRVKENITISTIARAKGNEAWKVYACRFHYATRPLAWKQESEVHKRNEAFVALTRARVWCVVTGIEGESSIFQELRDVLQQYPNMTFKSFNKSSLERIHGINDEEPK